jgi:hypothetical protein
MRITVAFSSLFGLCCGTSETNVMAAIFFLARCALWCTAVVFPFQLKKTNSDGRHLDFKHGGAFW